MKVNRADVFTRSDGRFDFKIIAAETGDTICQSSQGYENRAFCIDMAKRALNADGHIHVDPVITFDSQTGLTGDQQ